MVDPGLCVFSPEASLDGQGGSIGSSGRSLLNCHKQDKSNWASELTEVFSLIHWPQAKQIEQIFWKLKCFGATPNSGDPALSCRGQLCVGGEASVCKSSGDNRWRAAGSLPRLTSAPAGFWKVDPNESCLWVPEEITARSPIHMQPPSGFLPLLCPHHPQKSDPSSGFPRKSAKPCVIGSTSGTCRGGRKPDQGDRSRECPQGPMGPQGLGPICLVLKLFCPGEQCLAPGTDAIRKLSEAAGPVQGTCEPCSLCQSDREPKASRNL